MKWLWIFLRQADLILCCFLKAAFQSGAEEFRLGRNDSSVDMERYFFGANENGDDIASEPPCTVSRVYDK